VADRIATMRTETKIALMLAAVLVFGATLSLPAWAGTHRMSTANISSGQFGWHCVEAE
jgi:hypothetical protein